MGGVSCINCSFEIQLFSNLAGRIQETVFDVVFVEEVHEKHKVSRQ